MSFYSYTRKIKIINIFLYNLNVFLYLYINLLIHYYFLLIMFISSHNIRFDSKIDEGVSVKIKYSGKNTGLS